MRAVNPATGAYIWQICVKEGPPHGPITVVPGDVAFTEGNVFRLADASDGLSLLEHFEPGSITNKCWAGPTIAGGFVFVGNEDGAFSAFAPPAVALTPMLIYVVFAVAVARVLTGALVGKLGTTGPGRSRPRS